MVWVPTLWGALLLLGGAALFVVALGWFANDLLAVDAPARGRDGRGATTLVVEGWLENPDLDQAAAVFRAGHYGRVLVTGGPTDDPGNFGGWKNFARRASAYLVAQGLPSAVITAVPASATLRDRTYHNALTLRAWALQQGVALDAVDVFTASVHSRRSRMLYRMALGDAVEVGVRAAVPDVPDARRWWRSSAATKYTMGEALSMLWTVCCFWPSADDDLQELLAVAAPAQPVPATPATRPTP